VGAIESFAAAADMVRKENGMTSPGKTPPAMKQLDTGKWVYPINSSGTEFSDEEFDSEEDALTAWRRTRVSYAKGPTPPTPPTPPDITRPRGGGIGD